MKKTFFIILLATLLTSCSGGGVGGPQSSPEAVVQAYFEALVADDCDKAISYVVPHRRDTKRYQCERKAWGTVRVDDIYVTQAVSGIDGAKLVSVAGEIESGPKGGFLVTKDHHLYGIGHL
jgi:hypothetical protein